MKALRELLAYLKADCPGCNYYKHPGIHIRAIYDENHKPPNYTVAEPCEYCRLVKAVEEELAQPR